MQDGMCVVFISRKRRAYPQSIYLDECGTETSLLYSDLVPFQSFKAILWMATCGSVFRQCLSGIFIPHGWPLFACFQGV